MVAFGHHRTMTDPSPHLLRNLKEAAEALRIGRTTLYQLIGSGRLPTVSIGGRRLITDDALRAFVASLDAEGRSEP